jgi:Cytochrome P450
MRLYPPAWGIAREALADCEIGGYHVPKGTQIFMVQRLVHRDGRWFDEPDKFKPERWDNELIKRLPRCAYFPFGDGPRICIGNHFAMMEAVLPAGHDRAAISPRDRAGADSRALAFDHASAPTPNPCAAPGEPTRGNTVTRYEPYAGEPVTDDLSSINPKVGLGLAPQALRSLPTPGLRGGSRRASVPCPLISGG